MFVVGGLRSGRCLLLATSVVGDCSEMEARHDRSAALTSCLIRRSNFVVTRYSVQQTHKQWVSVTIQRRHITLVCADCVMV